MPRIRSVHPDICISDTMAGLSAELERTFVRLWTHCDDEGRCEDRIKIIKAALYPLHDDVSVEVLDDQLTSLHKAGLIIRYESAGQSLIQVLGWSEYQHPQKPRPSAYAAPTDEVREDHRTKTVHTPSEYASGVGVGKGEGDGKGKGTLAPLALEEKSPRPRNLLFDAVAEVCRIDPAELTKSYKGAFGQAVSDLKAVEASPEEVHRRAANWETLFPQATLTPSALAKHWAQLAQARPPNRRPDRFVEMGKSLNDRIQRQREGVNDGQPGTGANQARRGLPEG